ncbi:hypothetical protein Tco_0682474 [Tanacetum coccineum]|uniref:Transposase n=1 Tax=Tanacetum coccineum TaxID=301880 RepID=A0ABQ4XR83_9ASTR
MLPGKGVNEGYLYSQRYNDEVHVATGCGDHNGPSKVVTGLPSFRILLSSGGFRPSCVIIFFIPSIPSLCPMSYGSHSGEEPIVPKFDMHTFTSSMTKDEVSALAEEYAIPLDLHPRFPSPNVTMDKLPVGAIVYCRSLGINPSVNLFRAFYKLNKQGHWFPFERRVGKGGHDKIFNEFCSSLKYYKDRFFLIDRRAILDAMPWRHHDSNVSDPPPSEVSVDDVRRLCENVIDLRPVHSGMVYEIGLTTIWKHVGYHPKFKDDEGNDAASMSRFLKFPIGRGTALRPDEVIVGELIPANLDEREIDMDLLRFPVCDEALETTRRLSVECSLEASLSSIVSTRHTRKLTFYHGRPFCDGKCHRKKSTTMIYFDGVSLITSISGQISFYGVYMQLWYHYEIKGISSLLVN